MKTIFSLLFFLFISTAVFAQSDAYSIYGIKGGINRVESGKTGVVLGLFGEYALSTNFSLRSETNFSAQEIDIESDNKKQVQAKLNYLNWPILGKFYMNESFSLEGGPQIGFLLSGKSKSLAKNDFKIIEFGLSVGLGYRLLDNIELGLRYNHGLTDITKTKDQINNKVLQLSLAVNL
ncbi:MAG: PorT family protein [Flavobacteriales bacterium]|jgi:hypothetical protein|nr:PorT family protein [Flavobacteriales bacterium]